MSLKEKIKESFFILEKSDKFEEESIKNIIKLGREYNIKYKNPYEHKFLKVTIKLSEPMIKEFENQLNL